MDHRVDSPKIIRWEGTVAGEHLGETVFSVPRPEMMELSWGQQPREERRGKMHSDCERTSHRGW